LEGNELSYHLGGKKTTQENPNSWKTILDSIFSSFLEVVFNFMTSQMFVSPTISPKIMNNVLKGFCSMKPGAQVTHCGLIDDSSLPQAVRHKQVVFHRNPSGHR
jgi:hypothetical protein